MTFQEKLNELLKRASEKDNDKKLSEQAVESLDIPKTENITKAEPTTQNAEIKEEKTENVMQNVQNEPTKTENPNINTDPTREPIYAHVKPESKEELNKYLDKVESEYVDQEIEIDLPDYFELEKKTYEEKSKEQVEAEAKLEADAKYGELEKQENQKADKKEEQLEEQKKTVAESNQNQIAATNTQYDKARISTENEALKRGLARSSIVLLQLGGIEEARAGELLDLQKSLTSSLEKIENDLAALDEEREQNLASLNLQKAAEISKSIEDKMNELEKKKNEVLEYNNKVTELEHKYNISIEETRKQLLAENAEATAELNKRIFECKRNEQITLLTNYYSKFGKEHALLELANDTQIAQKVGIDVYYTVYRNILNRTY